MYYKGFERKLEQCKHQQSEMLLCMSCMLRLRRVGFEKPPTQVQLKGMPYLSNIVKEILRLYPPIAMNMRSATADTTLPVGGGPHGTLPIGIPRGTQICI